MKELLILMIVTYFNGLYPSTQYKAIGYVGMVIDESRIRDIDPLMIGTNITFESGWRATRIGLKKEIGLTQIKTSNRVMRHRLLRSPRLQVSEGVRLMKEKLDQCEGNVILAFGAYVSGKCGRNSSAIRRYRYYRKYRRMYRRGDR